MHQAGLDSVDELGQGVLADIVQRVCLALGAVDAADAPERVAELQRALAALPRLERFVTDVCEVSRLRTPLPATYSCCDV